MIINGSSTVSSIILFGSAARLDHDLYSDIDICLIYRGRKPTEKVVLPLLSDKFNINAAELVLYTEREFNKMVSYGSLFLWHLKLEGKVLYDAGFYSTNIKLLARYSHHLEEIDYHISILDDMEQAYARYAVVNELDLSIVFTFIRNACMILCHLNGKYFFGRMNVFQIAKQLYPDFPVEYDTYQKLSFWKLVYERGIDIKQELPDTDLFKQYLCLSGAVLIYARNQIQIYLYG